MWLAIRNRVPTWDILKKRNKQGPSICIMCISEDENISHLFIKCPFAQQISSDIVQWYGFPNLWQGLNIEDCLRIWFQI
jgi:hypothetical protein